MQQQHRTELTRSSGNVFLDLGFPPEEAEHLLIRADLMIHLQKVIASRGLKRAQAAKTLRVPPSRFSDLLRGRVDLFTTDALIDMLVLNCIIAFLYYNVCDAPTCTCIGMLDGRRVELDRHQQEPYCGGAHGGACSNRSGLPGRQGDSTSGARVGSLHPHGQQVA